MPENPFPDSLEKDVLRHRDASSLKSFQARLGCNGFSYCGLTSAEFRDVQVWRAVLSSVCAVEMDSSISNDLHINWRRLHLNLPFKVVQSNIFDYLTAADTPCYDVYNIDLYGGFTYASKTAQSPSREAIFKIASRHRAHGRPFSLIATFNVRDTGVQQYDALLGEIRDCVEGLEGISANLQEHGTSHATKIKLCYTFSCWHAGRTHDFVVEFADPVLYSSGKTNLVHFYAEFYFRSQALPTPAADRDRLCEIAGLPLRRMVGRIPQVELRPTRIVKPS